MTSTTSSSSTAPTDAGDFFNGGAGSAQTSQGQSIGSFLSALAVSAAVFGIECGVFLFINDRLQRIYLPRTYLVSEKERTAAPPHGLWQWMIPTFKTSNAEFIQKCGLDAYFFIRYLLTLLRIFVPVAVIVLPILFSVNAAGGRGSHFAEGPYNTDSWTNVTGLDVLAWGNIRPTHNGRYWTHLILAVCIIAYACYVFYDELRNYIRMRQAYLTSPQHRLRASATTVLVTAIPAKWCTTEALDGLYDVFPGGIRNIWINRNFDELSDKITKRNKLAKQLESAETSLVKKAKQESVKKVAQEAKKAKAPSKTKAQKAEEALKVDEAAVALAQQEGLSAGNPHQVLALEDYLDDAPSEPDSRSPSPTKGGLLGNVPVFGQGFERVGRGVNNLSSTLGNTIGKTVLRRGSGANALEKRDSSKVATTNDADADADEKAKPAEPGLTRSATTKSERSVLTRYGTAVNEDFDANGDTPKWSEYIKPKDRETMRLPIFGWQWMCSLPFVGEKVDKIDYCRKELARLNLEIETDQRRPDKYPVMSSAFVQFNHQVAAHMACQAVSHHVPNQMAPRVVEISPGDVVWSNMSIKWWESYVRTAVVLLLIVVLVVGWAVPVTFTGALSHISYLEKISWLAWVSRIPTVIVSIIQGVLPPALLALLFILLPVILRFLSKTQGDLNGMSIEMSVQKYYFAFLFIQLFLIISISSGITTIIPQLARNPQSVPSLLASNLPKASNYFFSYMLLQAFSVSGGALVQIGALVSWYILAPLLDSTARQKWRRQMKLPKMQWGTFFPVYTNLACIGLIYSVISPLILVFNIITFSLFWFVYRYNTLYVTKFTFDTGGLLFPTAINQLFTGLYFMELCLIGLFLVVRNAKLENGVYVADGSPCKAQAIIMIVVLILTVVYQWLLNDSFGPLLRYLPITLEDDAVMRDEEFARAQEKRWAVEDQQDEAEDGQDSPNESDSQKQGQKALETVDDGAADDNNDDHRDTNGAAATQIRFVDPPRDQLEMQERSATDEGSSSTARKRSDSTKSGGLGAAAAIRHKASSWAKRDRRSSDRDTDEHDGDDTAGKSGTFRPGILSATSGAVQSAIRAPTPRRRRNQHRHRDRRRRHALLHPGSINGNGSGPARTDPLSRIARDLESGRLDESERMAEALLADLNDDIEDLSPDDRDKLIQRAFQHDALRARRPVIWLPRDDLGVSDDEVRRTQQLTEWIWISNEGTALDHRGRVVYRRNPPDFSEIDLIEL